MAYGDGKSIIEIVNIGFEPLLTNEEYDLFLKIGELDKLKYQCEKTLSWFKSKFLYLDYDDCYYKWLYKHYEKIMEIQSHALEERNYLHDEFKRLLKENIPIIRTLNDNREFKNQDQFRNINIFESDITRCFECSDMQHSDDIISVVTYYTEIFDCIIHNGFMYKNIHFVFYTAGAGQTRNKKSTFVNEELFNKCKNRLFCGLTEDKINELGGMNTNKYLAYTSLSQSNTSIWNDFDIHRAIVVPDIEFEIPNQIVRYIYTETPDDKEEVINAKNLIDEISIRLRTLKNVEKNENGCRNKNIIDEEKELKLKKASLIEYISDIRSKYHTTEIKEMSVKIPYTDGFGIMFKREPNCMVRMPFMKGLLSYVPKSKFKQWCKDNDKTIYKVKDIYGKEYSIDEIDYMFTESQFKMHKYYENEFDENNNRIRTGWEVYKDNFIKYGCTANRCNIEGKVKLNAKTNYQVLQTLTTEMTDENIKELATYDIDNLNGIGSNLQCMLNILGADENKNERMNYFQKSLILYPEMFKDYYVKTLLKNTKNSMIKKIKSGKFNINGAYTFIIPEPLACLQWWFNGERDINNLGLLKDNNVYCRLFENNTEVDCLRSPHLDHAHCIRDNIVTDELISWYKTSGIYVGVKDIMSKLLMYDNDGDKALVHNNQTIIKCAKSFQEKYGMIPNYYDMPKANPQMINSDNLFDGITNAYHHGNIGTPSNEITKIFDTLNVNSTEEEIKEAIEIVALRCCDVNYVIDYAKTLYKPDIPKNIKERYKQYSGRKVPKFFIYAKDKTSKQVEEISSNNINRISEVVKPGKIVFKDPKVLGNAKFSYKIMMNNSNIKYTDEEKDAILSLYREYEIIKMRQLRNLNFDELNQKDKEKNKMFLEKDAIMQRDKFVEMLGMEKEFVCDVLIKELQDDANKDSLWKLFGDVIYNNLENNLKGTKRCECCGTRFIATNNSAKYCSSCAEFIKAEQKKKWDKKNKNKK